MNLQQIVNQILSVNPITSISTIEENLTAKKMKFIHTDLLNDLDNLYDLRGIMVVTKVPTTVTRTMTQMNYLVEQLHGQDITVWAYKKKGGMTEIKGTVCKQDENGSRFISLGDTVKCYKSANIQKLQVGNVTITRKTS